MEVLLWRCHTPSQTVQRLHELLWIMSTPSAELGIVLQKRSCPRLPIDWWKQVLPCFSVPGTREGGGGAKSAVGWIPDSRDVWDCLLFSKLWLALEIEKY